MIREFLEADAWHKFLTLDRTSYIFFARATCRAQAERGNPIAQEQWAAWQLYWAVVRLKGRL